MDKEVFADQKSSFLQIRIREDLKDDLKIAADSCGLTVSGLLHLLINKAVSELRRERPDAFPDYVPPPVVVGDNEFAEMLTEALDGKQLTPETRRAIEIAIRTALQVQIVDKDNTEIKP